jgi:UDP-N-acetylmuramate--alanine ligase
MSHNRYESKVKILTSGHRVHIVGIGGTGMSAIARVLLDRGVKVSGSDRALNEITKALARDGATVVQGHTAANIGDAEALIVSSAIHDNPEVDAANAAGLPVYKRKDILPALLENRRVIAVAGTHGKTTTTAMTAHILCSAGIDPGYIVGSVMENTGTNASGGTGTPFVIEADEYDDMYLGIAPDIAILTSAEWDHPDYFPTESDMLASFSRFVGGVRPNGLLIVDVDDWRTRAVASSRMAGETLTYGFDKRADIFMHNVRVGKDGRMRFDVYAKQPMPVMRAEITLRVVGRHNAANAVAAALAAEAAGVPFEEAVRALKTFESTDRRFTVAGEVGSLVVIDDYGHHPTAIARTLEAARMAYPKHTIWAVWQPHTYSRTQALMSGYARAFADADHVLVTEIYAAREEPLAGVDPKRVAKAIRQYHDDVIHTGDLEATAERLIKRVRGRSLVIVFSAGDAPKVGEMLLTARRAERRKE